MRKVILVLLIVLIIPAWTLGAAKHGARIKAKVHDVAHKKHMKKAAKQAPGAKKHFQK